MNFTEGDKVKYLDEVGGGTILRIVGKWALILDQEGFEHHYLLAKLVINEQYDAWNDPYDKRPPKAPEPIKRPTSPPPSNNRIPRGKLKNSMVEVDLHIEELMDSFMRLSNGEIIQIQLEHFERKLAWGYRKRLKKMVFIHGIGQGVLKNELRVRLSSYDYLDFHDASYREYGHGATEVVFRYH